MERGEKRLKETKAKFGDDISPDHPLYVSEMEKLERESQKDLGELGKHLGKSLMWRFAGLIGIPTGAAFLGASTASTVSAISDAKQQRAIDNSSQLTHLERVLDKRKNEVQTSEELSV